MTEPGARPSESEPSQREVRQWLAGLAETARPWVRQAVGAGILAGVATIIQMALLAWIVHQAVVVERPAIELAVWFLVLLGVLLIRSVFQGLQSRAAANCSREIRNNLRRELARRWRMAGPVAIAAESPAAMAREWQDHVDALHGYFARFLPQLRLAGLLPLVILLVVFWLDWLAALFLLLSAPLIPLFMALVGMGAEKLNQQHFQTISRLSGQFLDRIRGLTTLQLFGQTEPAAVTLEQRSDDYRRITMKTLKVAFLSSAVLEFFSSVAIAVIAMYIGFGLLGYIDYGPSDSLTLFSGLLVLLLAPEFFQPLRLLAQHYHDRAAALGAGVELMKRLRVTGDQPLVPAGQSFPPGRSRYTPDFAQGLELDRVTLAYPDRTPLFRDLSLSLPSGQVTALTGPSGGGKSSLLFLLAGFVPPDHGAVRVFGGPAGSLPVGWLGQSPFLAHGSWADNLRLVAPEASDVAIETAIRQVGLGHLLDERRDGIHSAVSEGGLGLSGGQARRLSLARIFVADYDLILLDEPTAALDPDSEVFVIEALRKLASQGKTLVLSTHQPALLTLADRVLLVERDDGEKGVGRVRDV